MLRPVLSLALAVSGVRACVRFAGLPDMPVDTAVDPKVYGISSKVFSANVAATRLLVRSSNLSWTLVGTAGEQLASSREIRERFAGVIFVGDSQIREIAWAALQMLAPRQPKRFYQHDRVFARQRPPGRSACVPQSIGKTGFTASCGAAAREPGAHGEPCELHSPFRNRSHAEAMRKLLLTKPHLWDGKLSVSEHVCNSDFFLSYQATWGAMPIDPLTLPTCLHPSADDPSGAFRLRNARHAASKPVLWIVDGCGLHEMEFCDARRNELPQHVLPRFSEQLLRSGTVVWQTVGAGFLMKAARRFRGECADVNADQVAANEVSWLKPRGVRIYDYTRLALQYAPMMFDAIHFTYYWVPCAYTFPEMARLVAQLGFQQAVGRPVEVCPPGTPDPPTASLATAGPARLGEPGGASVSLAQDAENTMMAYHAALKLSGKAAGKSKGGVNKARTAGADAAVAEGVNAALMAEQQQLQFQRQQQQLPPQSLTTDTAANAAKAGQQPDATSAAERTGATSRASSLAQAVHSLAVQHGGGKKRSTELEGAIMQLAKQYHAHD